MNTSTDLIQIYKDLARQADAEKVKSESFGNIKVLDFDVDGSEWDRDRIKHEERGFAGLVYVVVYKNNFSYVGKRDNTNADNLFVERVFQTGNGSAHPYLRDDIRHITLFYTSRRVTNQHNEHYEHAVDCTEIIVQKHMISKGYTPGYSVNIKIFENHYPLAKGLIDFIIGDLKDAMDKYIPCLNGTNFTDKSVRTSESPQIISLNSDCSDCKKLSFPDAISKAYGPGHRLSSDTLKIVEPYYSRLIDGRFVGHAEVHAASDAAYKCLNMLVGGIRKGPKKGTGGILNGKTYKPAHASKSGWTSAFWALDQKLPIELVRDIHLKLEADFDYLKTFTPPIPSEQLKFPNLPERPRISRRCLPSKDDITEMQVIGVN